MMNRTSLVIFYFYECYFINSSLICIEFYAHNRRKALYFFFLFLITNLRKIINLIYFKELEWNYMLLFLKSIIGCDDIFVKTIITT